MGLPCTGTVASASFTPAATAHGARDVLGGAKELQGLAISPGESRWINTIELFIAGATAVTTLWELHLYSVTPPSAILDDAVYDIPSGDRSSYLGFIPIGQTVDYGASQYGSTLNVGKQIKVPVGTSVWAYLVPISGITTEAVAHTVKVHSTLAW